MFSFEFVSLELRVPAPKNAVKSVDLVDPVNLLKTKSFTYHRACEVNAIASSIRFYSIRIKTSICVFLFLENAGKFP